MLVLTQARKKNLTEHNYLSLSRQARHRADTQNTGAEKKNFTCGPKEVKRIRATGDHTTTGESPNSSHLDPYHAARIAPSRAAGAHMCGRGAPR